MVGLLERVLSIWKLTRLDCVVDRDQSNCAHDNPIPLDEAYLKLRSVGAAARLLRSEAASGERS